MTVDSTAPESIAAQVAEFNDGFTAQIGPELSGDVRRRADRPP